jgi:hypothetical protein
MNNVRVLHMPVDCVLRDNRRLLRVRFGSGRVPRRCVLERLHQGVSAEGKENGVVAAGSIAPGPWPTPP